MAIWVLHPLPAYQGREECAGCRHNQALAPAHEGQLTNGSILLPFSSMSQPVKLSDALVLDARIAGKATERSIAGQVQFWANLGRAIEPLLQGNQVLALINSGGAKPLSTCIEAVDSPQGRGRVADYLRSGPYPHYEAASNAPGLLVRIDADGRRTVGRFVNRRFREVKAAGR
jgi:hypothetical protein